jgi:hypothetical protein
MLTLLTQQTRGCSANLMPFTGYLPQRFATTSRSTVKQPHGFGRITSGESARPSLLAYASACVHRQTTLGVLMIAGSSRDFRIASRARFE